ncbi:Uncharacterised protein [uncultured archaeon]|nr:Uncharacterised protein [uncultured archaeon]
MKKLDYKRYKLYQILLTIVLAALIGIFVTMGNFVIPLIVFAIAVLVMFVLKKNVNFKLTDERLETFSGKASRVAMTAFAFAMSIVGIVLISLRNVYPQYLLLGNVLIYSECGMILLYSILFKYYSKKK